MANQKNLIIYLQFNILKQIHKSFIENFYSIVTTCINLCLNYNFYAFILNEIFFN